MAKSELTESAKQEERRWKVKEAARTLKEFVKLKRDKKLIEGGPGAFEAGNRR